MVSRQVGLGLYLRLFSSGAFFSYVRLRTHAQYASMNEFTCSEHSVRMRRSKKRSTGKQPLRSMHTGRET